MRVAQIKPIHVGFKDLTAVVKKSTVFLDIMLCSLLKVNQHFGGTYCSSETLVEFQWIARCCIPEHGTLLKPIHLFSHSVP
jgi:hypothetical protein